MCTNQSWKRVRTFPVTRLSLAAAIAVCCASLVGPFGIANATPSAGFASNTVGPTDFGELDVKSGSATYYDGDDPTCTAHVLVQGDGFVDAGDGDVHMIRIEGAELLELIAFQIIPQGAVRRIDVAAPATAGF